VNGNGLLKLVAWGIALTLVALPVIGVLNGWFASDRWPVTQLSVRAEFNHVSAEQISAAAQPLLGEGFFAIKLDRVRDAVAKLPWVERTEARKRWPDTIDLVVYEQQPYARWGEDRLINRHGAVFNVTGANGLQGLPRLAGPDDRLADVLAFYVDCLREFSGSGLVIDAVTLSPRGGWRLDLASGAVIELGREDSRRRLQRFLDVWPRLVSAHAGSPAYVDLRYENGFAMRWPDAPAAPPHLGFEIRNDQPSAVVKPSGFGNTAPPLPDPLSRIPNPQSRIPAPI
jgi:cell division protein FtsQ